LFDNLDPGQLAETLWEILHDRLVLVLLAVAAATVGFTVVAVGWMTQPDRITRGFAPDQEIPFSHRLHAGQLNVPCAYCHSGTELSRHAGLPPWKPA